MFVVATFVNCAQAGIGVGVAGTRAVTQFTNGVIGTVFYFSVFFGLKVASMATGAIRLIAAVGPGWGLTVGAVAVAAVDTRFVVAGITGPGVSETGR